MASRCSTVEYPGHRFAPEDLVQFVEMPGFTDAWERHGLDDDDLHALQISVMLAPGKPPVIPGTGGLRKIRFAPEDVPFGKSGGYRICYAYFAEVKIVLLVSVYTKKEKDGLSASVRKALKAVLATIKEELCK